MKKVISILLSIVMLTSVLAGVSFNAYALEASGSCGSTTYTFDNSTGALDITGTGSIETNLFKGNTDIKSVVIGDNVTNICDSAFRDCRNLTSVTLGDSVANIGFSAFSGCTSLEEIDIPSSLTEYGGSVFYNCSSLKKAIIDSPVVNDNYSFDSCSSLKEVVLGDNVKTIDKYAFKNCKALTTVTMGKTIKTIGYEAFYNCVNLKNVIIPDSVVTIGEYAFGDCKNMDSVVIGSGVTAIYFAAFNNDDYITSVGYTGTTAMWSLIDINDGGNDAIRNRLINCADGLACGAHKFVKDKAVAATCTAVGYTEGEHCSICGLVKTPQQVVPMKAHNYPSYAPEKCRTCGTANPAYVKQPAAVVPTTNNTVVAKPAAAAVSKVTSPAKKSIKITWKKVAGVAGYEVQVATNSKFTKNKRAVTVKASKTSATIKKLSSKKKYFVRIRSYKVVNNKKVYSKWSKVKTIKTK